MRYELKQRALRTVGAITLATVAALGFTLKPASAMPSVHYGETTAGVVQEIGDKGKRGYHRHHHHHHHYGYRGYYRPYYGYGYSPGYYYGGYAYPYPYWGRPGMSIQFGF